ncbi:MAG: hypothetical protein GYB25_03410 [Rhodobacteraceae bacterium]|nr:hypothetical protein [Paracoccaceae bacterium]
MHSSENTKRSLKENTALWLTAGLVLSVSYLTLSPASSADIGITFADKIYHTLAFAALVLPCACLYPRGLRWVLPAAVIFGGCIELIQPFVGRDGDWWDFLADVLGIGLGLVAGLPLGKYFR